MTTLECDQGSLNSAYGFPNGLQGLGDEFGFSHENELFLGGLFFGACCDCTVFKMYLERVVRPRRRIRQYQLPQYRTRISSEPLKIILL